MPGRALLPRVPSTGPTEQSPPHCLPSRKVTGKIDSTSPAGAALQEDLSRLMHVLVFAEPALSTRSNNPTGVGFSPERMPVNGAFPNAELLANAGFAPPSILNR